jgi:nitric-oxide synthase
MGSRIVLDVVSAVRKELRRQRLVEQFAEPTGRTPTGERRLRECDEFFRLPELAHLPPARRIDALAEFKETGQYVHSAEELLIGARLAWRNHARCVGRKHWRSLKLLDMRHATTADGIAEACREHLRVATNGGALQSVITVGPPPRADGREYRVISPQLIRYAGYRTGYGGTIGDPAHIALTEFLERLGWHGSRTRFDVLPLLISTPDEPLRWFEIPGELVREVDITHPDYPWFADLGLKWHAVPAVSNMNLEIGGLTYPCAPFSGWYVNTEVGARDLSDPDRYNMLPLVADKLGLDTASERTLWRDRALLELNRAVLHSYRSSGVYMVDHHTVAKQFIDHVTREERAGRACPADWSWINPPMSAVLTPTFHRYYAPADPDLRPNFVKRDGTGTITGCPAH